MELFVKVLAPRSRLDFVVKLFFVLVVLWIVYLIQKVAFDGWPDDGLGNDVRGVLLLGAPFGWLALALIGHLYRLQTQLETLASTDLLTGLPNRRGFLETVCENGSLRDDGVLILIDVDHFKHVNDTHGHAVGDLCLQAVARYLKGVVRVDDMVGRYGGEEFVAFLPTEASARLHEMGDAFPNGFPVRLSEPKITFRVSVSAGAIPVIAGMPVDLVLAAADKALYEAKESGRARLVVHSCEPFHASEATAA